MFNVKWSKNHLFATTKEYQSTVHTVDIHTVYVQFFCYIYSLIWFGFSPWLLTILPIFMFVKINILYNEVFCIGVGNRKNVTARSFFSRQIFCEIVIPFIGWRSPKSTPSKLHKGLRWAKQFRAARFTHSTPACGCRWPGAKGAHCLRLPWTRCMQSCSTLAAANDRFQKSSLLAVANYRVPGCLSADSQMRFQASGSKLEPKYDIKLF